MTTRAQMLARRHAAPVLVATIDAMGTEADGQWKFCTRVPSKYSTADAYKPWITTFPQIVPERLPLLGGVANSGELSLPLLDVDDALTAQLALLAAPVAYTVGMTAAATSCFLSRVISDGIYWVGLEAIDFTYVSGLTYNMTRAQLGTTAQAHPYGAKIYGSNPFVLNRRVRLYLSFDDTGYNTTREAEGEIGRGWHVAEFDFQDELNTALIRARSRLKHIDRVVMRSMPRAEVVEVSPDGRTLIHSDVRNDPGLPTAWASHFDDPIYLRVGDNHIIEVEDPTARTQVTIRQTGRLGTAPEPYEIGAEVRQVFIAGKSFRYQEPGAETSSRSTGTWIETKHPVPIMLALLTSSVNPNDDDPDNYASGSGNYSALPGGVGLGVPMAEINHATFLEVWGRTAGEEITHFVIDGQDSGRAILEEICQVYGLGLVSIQGKIGLKKYRSPLAGESGTSWGLAEFAEFASPKIDTSRLLGGVRFEGRSDRGREVTSTFTNASFREVLGDPNGFYESEARTVTIRGRFLRFGVGGDDPEIVRRRAFQLLQLNRRPQTIVRIFTDLAQADVETGETVLVTHPQAWNAATGTRGWVDVPCTVESKREVIQPERVGIDWTLRTFGATLRVGRVCPSACINGAPSGNVATVHANRYTDPGAQDGLPTNDIEAFTVGDVVMLTDRAGARVATTPTYQTVATLTPGSNTIELDGNFGGASEWANGYVIQYVDRDDATTTQAERYVHMADETDLTVGSSSDPAWSYSDL